MFRMFRTILALLIFASPLAAQGTASADATATVTIDPFLVVTNTTGLAYGNHFASAGVLTSSGSNFARWDGQSDPNSSVRFDFTLPTGLARVGGGGSGPVPITFGSSSVVYCEGGCTRRDPATGDAIGLGPTGGFWVTLGEPSATPQPSDFVSINLTGRAPGTYQGIITLTVSVL